MHDSLLPLPGQRWKAERGQFSTELENCFLWWGILWERTQAFFVPIFPWCRLLLWVIEAQRSQRGHCIIRSFHVVETNTNEVIFSARCFCLHISCNTTGTARIKFHRRSRDSLKIWTFFFWLSYFTPGQHFLLIESRKMEPASLKSDSILLVLFELAFKGSLCSLCYMNTLWLM